LRHRLSIFGVDSPSGTTRPSPWTASFLLVFHPLPRLEVENQAQGNWRRRLFGAANIATLPLSLRVPKLFFHMPMIYAVVFIYMIEVSSISRNHFHNANKEALKLIIAFDKKLRANLTFINLHID
jgi:hypothetical protein